MTRAQIIGTGSYAPEKIMTNHDLAKIVETATVTDGSGNVVDLKNLRPDGSIGEPEPESETQSVTQSESEPAAAE